MKSNEQKLKDMKISDVPIALELAFEIVVSLESNDDIKCPICHETVIHNKTCPVWKLDMMINNQTNN